MKFALCVRALPETSMYGCPSYYVFFWSPINYNKLCKIFAKSLGNSCNEKYPIWSSVPMYISEDSYQKFSEQLCSSYFSDKIFSKHLRSDLPVDIRRPWHHINILISFNLGCVPTGLWPQIKKILEN